MLRMGDFDDNLTVAAAAKLIGVSKSRVDQFIGDGRLAYAPVEDLFFGFAMVLWSQSLWIWFGKRGVQYEPTAGPPVWERRD